MHALITLGCIAIGALAALAMFLELRRRRHYIGYLLRHGTPSAPATRRELGEGIGTGLFIAGMIVLALVLS